MGLPCCRPSCESIEKLPNSKDRGLDDLTSLLSLNRVLKALVNVVLDMLVREHLVEFTATLHRPGIPCLFARVQGASAP